MALSPGILAVLTLSWEHQCCNKSLWSRACFPTHQCQETIDGSQQRRYASSWNATGLKVAAFFDVMSMSRGTGCDLSTYSYPGSYPGWMQERHLWCEWGKGLCGGDRVVVRSCVWCAGGSKEGYAFSSVQETATVEPKDAQVLSAKRATANNSPMTCQTSSLAPLRKQQHISSTPYQF